MLFVANKIIEEKEKEKDLVNSGMMNYLFLGWHYNIITITSKFEQLTNENETFRQDICCRPFSSEFQREIERFVFRSC